MVRVREESEPSSGGGGSSGSSRRDAAKGGSGDDGGGGGGGATAGASTSPPKENNNNVKREKSKREEKSEEKEEMNGVPEETTTVTSTKPSGGGGEKEESKREKPAPPENRSSSRSYYSQKKYVPYKSYQSSSWNHHGGNHHHTPSHGHHSHHQHHHSGYDYGGYDTSGDPGGTGGGSWGASSNAGIGAGPYGSSYSFHAAAAFYDLGGTNGVPSGGGYYNSSGYYGASYGHHKRRGGGPPRHGRSSYHSRTNRPLTSPSSQNSLTITEAREDGSSPTPAGEAATTTSSGMSATNDRSPTTSVAPSNNHHHHQHQHHHQQHQQHHHHHHGYHHQQQQHHHQQHHQSATVEEIPDDGGGDAGGGHGHGQGHGQGHGHGENGNQLVLSNQAETDPSVSMCAVALPSAAATVEAMGACGLLTPLTAPNGTVGQIVHLHIGLGEAMQFQVGDQLQLVSAAFGWFCSGQEPNACELCVPPVFLGYFMLPDGGDTSSPAAASTTTTNLGPPVELPADEHTVGDVDLDFQNHQHNQMNHHQFHQVVETEQIEHLMSVDGMVIGEADMVDTADIDVGVDVTTLHCHLLTPEEEASLAGPATVRMPVPMQVSTGQVVVEDNGSYRPYYLPGVHAQMMQIPPYGAGPGQGPNLGQTYYQFTGPPPPAAAQFAAHFAPPPPPPPPVPPAGNLQTTTTVVSSVTSSASSPQHHPPSSSSSPASVSVSAATATTTTVDAGTTTDIPPPMDGMPPPQLIDQSMVHYGHHQQPQHHHPGIVEMTDSGTMTVGPSINGQQSSPVHGSSGRGPYTYPVHENGRGKRSSGGYQTTASATAGSGDVLGLGEYQEERELVDILSTIQPPQVSQLKARSAMLAWSMPTALSELLAYVASTAAAASADNAVDDDETAPAENDAADGDDDADVDPAKEQNGEGGENKDEKEAETAEEENQSDTKGDQQQQKSKSKSKSPSSSTAKRKKKRREGEGDGGDGAGEPSVPECKFSKQIQGLASVMDQRDLRYDVLLSDKGHETRHFKSIYFGTAKDCQLTDLKPATEYHICIRAVYEEIRGRLCDTLRFSTQSCEPDTPHPPKCSSKTKNALHLKWNPPCENGEKVTNYILESDEGRNGPFTVVYDGPSKTCRLTKLQPACTYRLRLAAVNRSGRSNWSEVVHIATAGSPPPPPAPPTCVKADVAHATVAWTARPGDDSFILQMEVGGPHGFIPQYNGRETSFVVSKLKRNSLYRFRLLACNDEGASNPSDVMEVRTLCDVPGRPAAPRTKGKILTHSFRLVWDPPSNDGGSPPTGYQLELDSGSGFKVVYSGPEAEHMCVNLAPGTTHRARVCCFGRGGSSDYSDPTPVTTLPVCPGQCAPPRVVGKPKATSVALKWSAPDADGGSPVTEFEVDVTCPNNKTVSAYHGPDTECVVSQLLPGTPYLFQVRAVNKAGAGAWSEPMEVVSGAGPPHRPREPSLTAKSSSVVAVRWEEPLNNGAAVSQYKLEMATHYHESAAPPRSPTTTTAGSPAPAAVVDASSFASVAGSDYLSDQWLSNLAFSPVYVGPLLSHDVKCLQPAGTYSFRVQASNSAGTSQFSSHSSITLPASVPGAVASVSCRPNPVTDEMSTCVHVSWGSVLSNGSPVTHFVVEATPSSSSSSAQAQRVSMTVLDPKADNCTVEGLLPETAYSIRVQAVNGVGPGPFSHSCRVTTRPLPPQPPRLELLLSTCNSLKLKWNDIGAPSGSSSGSNHSHSNHHHHGHGHHLHNRSVSPSVVAAAASATASGVTYALEMENPKHPGRFYAVFSGSGLSYKVTKLNEASRFRFRINARNESGPGPYSSVSEFWTTKAPPHSIKAPRVIQSSGGACTIEWQAVKPPAGPDTISYRLQMVKSSGSDPHEIYSGKETSFAFTHIDPTDRELSFRVCAVREPAAVGDDTDEDDDDAAADDGAADTSSNSSDDDEDGEGEKGSRLSDSDSDGTEGKTTSIKNKMMKKKRIAAAPKPPPHIASTPVVGPWSPWTVYRPPHTAADAARDGSTGASGADAANETAADSAVSPSAVNKQLTDNQWAVIFVIVLTVAAVILSIVINYAMSDSSLDGDDDASSPLRHHQGRHIYDEYDPRVRH